ncbi:MAG: hydroxymethylbilane synthase [Candidatus Eutrophobiaceae bacterium]
MPSSPSPCLRIATRKSPLAMWQARHVCSKLQALHPRLRLETVPVQTAGDRFLDSRLAAIGGKDLFIKELEDLLLCGRADIAVHSMKDVSMQMPEELCLPTILARGDCRDALVARGAFEAWKDLPKDLRIGTSSPRRRSQVLARHPSSCVVDLRGNVGTRLAKLDAGEYDALILAAAGLQRLGLEERVSEFLDPMGFLPAVGQGAIGIECRRRDDEIQELIADLHDELTALCISAERGFARLLYGGCQLPIAAWARLEGGMLVLDGLVASLDGQRVLRDQLKGEAAQAKDIGEQLAQRLCAVGAKDILEQILAEAGSA